jgi:hypothetical protein
MVGTIFASCPTRSLFGIIIPVYKRIAELHYHGELTYPRCLFEGHLESVFALSQRVDESGGDGDARAEGYGGHARRDHSKDLEGRKDILSTIRSIN